jgi:hypothetical protein
MLAYLLASLLGGIASPTLVAEEPAAPPPPAKSIREWKTASSPAPATSTSPAKSIREWRTTPNPAPEPCPAASPIAGLPVTPAKNAPAAPAAPAAAPTKPITISLTSSLRRGSLVVMLDDVPIFNEKFQKPLLAFSQTTTWDPLKVRPGTHRLSARLHGTKKTYFSKSYDLQLSPTKEAVLRFVMQGDKLVVELAS